MSTKDWLHALPKAELHMHIEGSLEPAMMLELARRNRVSLPYPDIDSIIKAYNFNCLQDFLDIYYQGMSVLLTDEDFHDLTWAYLLRCQADNVVHTEIFFDPQGHTERGVAFATVIDGITTALDRGRAELGISSRLIMCFLRHLDEDSAFRTLEEALPWRERIAGVGLDSSERGHPPAKFQRVFAAAGREGFRRVAHAGEEGPPEYVREALDLLRVERIDHGNRALEDPALVARLAELGIPLTVCPQSNLRLAVIDDMRHHPIRDMLQAGLRATVNSDDPAYFGGYVNDNFDALIDAIDLQRGELLQLVVNSFEASFLPAAEIRDHVARVRAEA
ncbi:MAG: adenosine deaminase [Xanthomonadales bacterium]|nr:adenosine deaminase [Xanthomonadales bacterium]NIN59426.1 adenosine deaminase [Xanthomonadales bacterium]NIN74777.1 adenosine deaminase [Xanthomonadales bacterium]NIO14015.1 adenosine deaminase [Xanthomonadales bacterium]NIP11819.1 adenosine deaminase [Xanthomonadales bacterium]